MTINDLLAAGIEIQGNIKVIRHGEHTTTWKANNIYSLWYENIIASIYFIGYVGIIPFAVFVNLTEETMGWRIASIVMIILSVMVWVITIIFIIADYSDWW